MGHKKQWHRQTEIDKLSDSQHCEVVNSALDQLFVIYRYNLVNLFDPHNEYTLQYKVDLWFIQITSSDNGVSAADISELGYARVPFMILLNPDSLMLWSW